MEAFFSKFSFSLQRMVKVLLLVLVKKKRKIKIKLSQEEGGRLRRWRKQKIDIYKEIGNSDKRVGVGDLS